MTNPSEHDVNCQTIDSKLFLNVDLMSIKQCQNNQNQNNIPSHKNSMLMKTSFANLYDTQKQAINNQNFLLHTR